MLDYTLTINGTDFTGMIERDSYSTKKVAVFSEAVVTMDGVTHLSLIRNKAEISFKLNPQTASDTATASAALLSMPCEVYYFNLQDQQYEYANAVIDAQSATYLSRCLQGNLRWNQIDAVTLTEL